MKADPPVAYYLQNKLDHLADLARVVRQINPDAATRGRMGGNFFPLGHYFYVHHEATKQHTHEFSEKVISRIRGPFAGE